jgi:hypothetical protein
MQTRPIMRVRAEQALAGIIGFGCSAWLAYVATKDKAEGPRAQQLEGGDKRPRPYLSMVTCRQPHMLQDLLESGFRPQ